MNYITILPPSFCKTFIELEITGYPLSLVDGEVYQAIKDYVFCKNMETNSIFIGMQTFCIRKETVS